MGLFYTGKGDKGKSALGKKKVSKLRSEFAALANLDELNSLLGLVKHQKLPKNFIEILEQVQEDIFIIQAHVGCVLMGKKYRPPQFKKEKITWMEKLIDGLEERVKPERKFVVPGTNESSAWLHFARAVSRRTELSLVRLGKRLEPQIPAYSNRLSGLLYAMARFAATQTRTKEKNPAYK